MKQIYRLREYRTKYKIRASDLALYLGVSRDTVYRYERGEQRIKGDQLNALAYLYGVTVDELLGARSSVSVTVPV